MPVKTSVQAPSVSISLPLFAITRQPPNHFFPGRLLLVRKALTMPRDGRSVTFLSGVVGRRPGKVPDIDGGSNGQSYLVERILQLFVYLHYVR